MSQEVWMQPYILEAENPWGWKTKLNKNTIICTVLIKGKDACLPKQVALD